MFTVDEDDRYDVTFHMKEKRWFGGGMHATFGGENNATMVKVYALSILWIKRELSIYTGLLIHINDHLHKTNDTAIKSHYKDTYCRI